MKKLSRVITGAVLVGATLTFGHATTGFAATVDAPAATPTVSKVGAFETYDGFSTVHYNFPGFEKAQTNMDSTVTYLAGKPGTEGFAHGVYKYMVDENTAITITTYVEGTVESTEDYPRVVIPKSGSVTVKKASGTDVHEETFRIKKQDPEAEVGSFFAPRETSKQAPLTFLLVENDTVGDGAMLAG